MQSSDILIELKDVKQLLFSCVIDSMISIILDLLYIVDNLK